MANLFPEFEMPQMTPEPKTPVNQNVTSYYFDFELGDFRSNGAGKSIKASPVENWIQWCMKAVNTERYRFRAYRQRYGAEWARLEDYNDPYAKESWIERTITETLLADPLKRTACVKDFNYTWDGDSADVDFAIYNQDGMKATLYVKI